MSSSNEFEIIGDLPPVEHEEATDEEIEEAYKEDSLPQGQSEIDALTVDVKAAVERADAGQLRVILEAAQKVAEASGLHQALRDLAKR